MKKQRKITIADIAREAGVSAMTVSRYLNGKGPVAASTAERIKAIIERLQYNPNWLARSLSSKKSMIIGVTIPRIEHALLDNYIAQILSGVTDVALQNDYRIMLLPFNPEHGTDNEFSSWYHSKMFDGLILLKTLHRDPRIKSLAEQKIPFVLANHKYYAPDVHFIDVNNKLGIRLAVEYLVQNGRSRIAFVAGDLRETNARDRWNAFCKTMQEQNLTVNKEWVIHGQFNQEIAYRESDKLFQGKTIPDAVVCSDDYMAIGVMRRIKERGLRIPDDVAVIGFDDIEIAAYIQPALTTVRQPIEKIGRLAAESLLKLLNGKVDQPIRRLLSVQLIKRESA
ncbi:LacI family DNA-binding transcriptional regulator [Caldithrix abyssi]